MIYALRMGNGYYIIFSRSGNISYGKAVYHIAIAIYHLSFAKNHIYPRNGVPIKVLRFFNMLIIDNYEIFDII